jgi:hypothetical protein
MAEFYYLLGGILFLSACQRFRNENIVSTSDRWPASRAYFVTEEASLCRYFAISMPLYPYAFAARVNSRLLRHHLPILPRRLKLLERPGKM